MLTKLFFKAMVIAALFVAVAGSSGVVSEQLGLDAVPSASACAGSGSGGGC